MAANKFCRDASDHESFGASMMRACVSWWLASRKIPRRRLSFRDCQANCTFAILNVTKEWYVAWDKASRREELMDFLKAFPIAIIDEDYEGKHAAGIGMRQLATALEKEGFRVVAGVSYADAQRLVEVFNSESCWIVSVDGVEASPSSGRFLRKSSRQEAPAQRPPADLSFRGSAHRGNGAGERAEARQRLHAHV